MNQYISRKGLDQVPVIVIIDGRDHAGDLDAWEQLDDSWRGHVVYRTHDGNHVGWFSADQIRPDETDYTAGRDSLERRTGDPPPF